MRRSISLCVFLVAGLIAGSAVPASAGRVDNAVWRLNLSPGRCTLTGITKTSYAQIESAAGTESYTVTLADRRKRGPNEAPFADVTIEVDGKPQGSFSGGFWKGENGFAQRYVAAAVSIEAIQAMRSAKLFAFKTTNGNLTSADLPNLSGAIASLQRCEAEQLIAWGADPAQFSTGGSTPRIADRMTLVPQSVMQRIRRSSRGPIDPLHHLVISPSGEVESCKAVTGIPGSDMEQVVCSYLAGKKVAEPATDPAGKAVRGVVALMPALIRTVTYTQ